MGWDKRELRVNKSPNARGAAEQWVRCLFVKELTTLRKRHVRSGLLTMIDADGRTVDERLKQLEKACCEAEIEFIRKDEAVALVVPRRNIETWIRYLEGEHVDEDTQYTKLKKARQCANAVSILIDRCSGEFRDADAPPSLNVACTQYHTRIHSLKRT